MKIAIGVMTRAPLPGQCKTRLIPLLHRDGAARLTQALLQDTLTSLEHCPAHKRVLFVTPPESIPAMRRWVSPHWKLVPQFGANLSVRLHHAFLHLSRGGYVPIISGSDAPLLDIQRIRHGVRTLCRPNQCLMIPAADGGYAMLGLSTMRAEMLYDMPWSTAAVAPTTRNRCQSLGFGLHELPPVYDVDMPEDLHRLQQDLQHAPHRAIHSARLLHSLSRTWNQRSLASAPSRA